MTVCGADLPLANIASNADLLSLHKSAPVKQ